MDDYYRLSDAEWEWVACFLGDRTAPSADALRGYLNDRITERLVTARAEEQARHGNNCGGMWDEWTHDLRAKIEALHCDALQRGDTYDIDDVLALIDGSSDE